ncbi:prolipoprotein diacylglyceryl transferase [Flavonifractor plautii]|uniref:prolipoprotein diacylglyceryl transferase n=1 Tax=Flavonifractor plautii TaxID=292800 RepID=UPI003034B8FE
MLPYLSLFGRLMPTYGVLGMAGLGFGLLAALLRCKRFGLSRDDCAYLYILGAVGALVGAKLLYLLPLLPRLAVELPLLWEEPGEFYARYLSGGMVFYGGFFGGVAAAWGAAKYLRLRLSDFFPVLVPALPLVHAVGRVGCFCAGCCYGRAAPPPWGIAFTHAIAGPNGVPLLPVQLWEAGAELVIFAFLLWYAGRAAGPGQMLRAYVFCYAPVRFVLEWFRGIRPGGCTGPSPRLSGSAWLFWPWPWRGLWRGGSSKNTSVKGYPSKRATETRAIQRIHKNHRKEETARADAPKRAAGSGCLNFRFHDSRRTFRQDLFYI